MNAKTSHIKTLNSLNYWFCFLALVLAVLNCPTFGLVYWPGIDGSLPWVFNFFANGNYLLGKETLFPHGPLAFLLYPLSIGNNLVVAAFTHVFISATMVFCWLKIQQMKQRPHYFIATLILYIFLAFADIQLLIIAFVVGLLWLYRQTNNKYYFFTAVLLSVFNLYIKTFGGVICSLLLLGEVMHAIITTKNYKLLLSFLAFYIFIFVLVWLLLYNNLLGSLTFLYAQVQLSLDNSEAVLFEPKQNWWLLSVCLLSFLTIFLILRKQKEGQFLPIFLAPAFAVWKHAMARSEEIHMTGFLCFLIMFAFFVWFISEAKTIIIHVLSLLSALSFFLNIPYNNDRTMGYRLRTMLRTANFSNYIFKSDSLAKLNQAHSEYYCRNLHLSDSILKIIDKKTVDIYPWNYAVVATNHLNWQPRPVINSYACYTHWLDIKNARHWDSGRAPQYVLWEQTDLDERGFEFESIDRRYVLNDEPNAMIRFFANYQLELKSGNYLTYKRRNRTLEVFKMNLLKKQTLGFNKWINIPPIKKTHILRIKIELKKTILGQLKSLFYKGEVFYIHYLLQNGTEYIHRIVPKNAEDGLWIHPLIMHPNQPNLESEVISIKLVCLNPEMVKSTFEINFEEINFSINNSVINIRKELFGKKEVQ